MVLEQNSSSQHAEVSSSAPSDDQSSTSRRSLFGPFKRKREIVPSQAEVLRNAPSDTVDRSARALFGLGQISANNATEASNSTENASTSSITASPFTNSTPSQGPASDATPASSIAPLSSRKRSRLDTSTTSERVIQGRRVFNREVDDTVRDRFRIVQEQLEPSLVGYLHKRRVEFRPLTLQLLMLGLTEDTAKPWIVVYCPKGAKSKIKSYFRKEVAKNICRGPSSCRVEFEVIVDGPLNPSESDTPDEVLIDLGQDDQENTETWTPQIKIMQSGLAHYATLGGLISVTDRQSKTIIYGLTAGHILKSKKFCDFGGTLSGDASTTDTTDEDTEEEDSENDETFANHYRKSMSTAESIPALEEPRDIDGKPEERIYRESENHSWVSLGAISAASYSDRARDRDWALIDLTAIHNAQLNVPRATTNEVHRSERPADGQSAVICNKSRVPCTVSSLPARAILPSGQKFVDVNVLQLTGSQVLSKGSSGSWIMDRGRTRFRDVYGALVATDPMGNLWMVPMTDILTDVHAVLNAAQVRLTNRVDAASNKSDNTVMNETSTEPNTERTIVVKSRINKLTPYSAKRPGPKLCPGCDATKHDGPCSDASSVNVVDSTPIFTRAPDFRSNLQSNIYNTASYGYSSGSSKSKNIISWYCSECCDGPYLNWQVNCQNCSHEKCGMCKHEKV